ncbi:15069_t:CDS:2 [Gigaspora margarita]|uniref:15069_t:CDS:1 n=1 Tax=Gigaspora margarita TaxID=4874 RepID=A0ABN7V8Z6_GIGMA|nr:15069_t:CDS:2 [Gigaspora margarita]
MLYQISDSETITNYDDRSLDFLQASPAVLQNCILGSSVISYPPITRIVDNWLHTYNIARAAGEAKEPGLQNKIFYAQAYHVEKEAFSASKSTLLEELNEKDAKNNSSKVNKACKAAISIFNEIINTYYGARLEYRIGFDITNQVLTIIQLKLDDDASARITSQYFQQNQQNQQLSDNVSDNNSDEENKFDPEIKRRI